jgi:hypothetical protein
MPKRYERELQPKGGEVDDGGNERRERPCDPARDLRDQSGDPDGPADREPVKYTCQHSVAVTIDRLTSSVLALDERTEDAEGGQRAGDEQEHVPYRELSP